MEVREKEKVDVVVEKKKRGRKRTKEAKTIKDQKKFFIDYTNDTKKHEVVVNLLTKVNQKNFGRVVVFKDLVDLALTKLTSKDLDKVKELTMDKMDKVKVLLEKQNQKNGTSLSLGEFLVDRLKIT